MADFSHLKKLDVTGASEAEYVFDDIVMGQDDKGVDICPSIWFAPMTDANPEYLNERVRVAVERADQTKKESRAQRKARMLSSEQLEEDRDLDRILMARICAKRWGTAPKAADGSFPEFSEENCLAFLRALPNYMLDPCRSFVSNVYNFVDRTALTEEDGEKLGN